MPANTGAHTYGVETSCAHPTPLPPDKLDLAAERAAYRERRRNKYKGLPAHLLPESMQPKVCVRCGGPRSFSSVAYCGACFKADRHKITLNAKTRRKLLREEKDRIVYRYRAPLLDALENAKTAQDVLSCRPAAGVAKGSEWLSPEKRALCLLVGADADISISAAILGRSASALAWKAKEIGLKLPDDWRRTIVYGPSIKREDLAFPYISKARPEHSDLLRVNDIVPKSFPEWQRADICQSIMLALFEGKVSLAELESNKGRPRYFIKEYYKKQQPWQELMGIGHEDDERSYEDIAASSGIGHNSIPMRRFVEPTQIEDAFAAQIARHQMREQMKGRAITLEEASWELEHRER